MYRSYCFYFSYPGPRDLPFQFFKKSTIGRVQILKIHRGTEPERLIFFHILFWLTKIIPDFNLLVKLILKEQGKPGKVRVEEQVYIRAICRAIYRKRVIEVNC